MFSKNEQTFKNKKPKQKRCKECKGLFTPERDLQPCCSFKCEMDYISNEKNLKGLVDDGKALRIKEANKKKKQFKDNDKSHLIQIAQKEVNKYIRIRDINKPCCSCGCVEGRQFHAGHYESVGGNQHQRFYTLNIHKQCSICNNHKSGNLIPYRLFMIDKYGLAKVEELENDHSIKKYTVEYLKRLIKVFRSKIRLYERRSKL
jgi:hypothetical protein